MTGTTSIHSFIYWPELGGLASKRLKNWAAEGRWGEQTGQARSAWGDLLGGRMPLEGDLLAG